MNRPAFLQTQSFKPQRSVPPGNSFIRLITAQAIAARWRVPVEQVVAELWPGEDIVQRAATAPAMTTVTGWAAELARKVVADAIQALAPAAAAAQIMSRGLVLTWDGAGVISVPAFVAGAGNASFVAEGDPIPVRQLASTAAIVNPHKLAAVAVLSRELMDGSNAEAAISDALVRSCGAALDAVFFDANAETAARPAGMKYNNAAQTPSAATDLWQAAFEDLAKLVNVAATVGGSGPYIVVGSPGRALAMALRFNMDPDDISLSFFGSTAMGDDLAVIAPAALATVASPSPEVETADAATLVMDTAPTAPGGTQTEKSMWQTNSLAIKVRWPVAWALRDPRGFAWMTPNWKPG